MQYVGTELDAFATAVHWKGYVCEALRPFVSGAVLEVGAGKGSFTVALHKLEHSAWLCLEPDPKLAAAIRSRQAQNEIAADITVYVGTERNLGPDYHFDTILYLDVLEH